MTDTLALDSNLYTPLTDLKRSRLADRPTLGDAAARLRQKPGQRPLAVMFRQIVTPSYETIWFTRKARRHGFDPLVVEHRNDVLSVHNPYKRSLITLPIVVGADKHGRPILRRQNLMRHEAAEGRPLCSLSTAAGESLLSYHHRQLARVMGAAAPRFVDLSDLLATATEGAAQYYRDFLGLFIGPVVLFEDFVVDERTAAFYQRVVAPAFSAATVDLGQRPQIARLMHGQRAGWAIWNSYPSAALDDPSWILGGGRDVALAG